MSDVPQDVGSERRPAGDNGGSKGVFSTTQKLIVGAALVAVVAVLLLVPFPFERRLCSTLDRGFGTMLCREIPASLHVQTPEVYTRARLLNDRIEQQNWFSKQLRLADRPLEFNTPDEVQHRRDLQAMRVALAAETTASTNAENDAKLSLESLAAKTTISAPQAYRAMKQYREDVRSDISRVQLDDRHDLEGNTVYTFKFPASVVGNIGADMVGLVVVKAYAQEDNWPGEDQVDVRYVKSKVEPAQEQWRQRVERLYSTSIDDYASLLQSPNPPSSLSQSLFKPQDMHTYAVQKLLCSQDFAYCPPHERNLMLPANPQTKTIGGRDGRSSLLKGSDQQEALRSQLVTRITTLLSYHVNQQDQLARLASRQAFYRTQLGYLRRMEANGEYPVGSGIAAQDDIYTPAGLVKYEWASTMCKAPNLLSFDRLKDDLKKGKEEKVETASQVEGEFLIAVERGARFLAARTRRLIPNSPDDWTIVAACPAPFSDANVVGAIFRLVGSSLFGPDLETSNDTDGLTNSERERRNILNVALQERRGGLTDKSAVRIAKFFGAVNSDVGSCREELISRIVKIEFREITFDRKAESWDERVRRLGGLHQDLHEQIIVSAAKACDPVLGEPYESRGIFADIRSDLPGGYDARAAMECAIADLRGYQATWPQYLSPTGRQIAFSDFLDVIPIRHGGRGCDISVRVKYPGQVEHLDRACELVRGQERETSDVFNAYEAALCKLHRELRHGVDIFAYSLSPPIQRSTIAKVDDKQRTDKAQATTTIPTVSQNLAAAFSSERLQAQSSIDSDATLISFVRPPIPDSESASVGGATIAEFGWAILQDRANLSARQFDLSVGLSVPGWFTEIPVAVWTCIVPVRSLEKGLKVSLEDCERPQRYKVKLPGDANEIARKLNLSVVNTPHVYKPEGPPQALRAGAEGKILIPGIRLWKNTYVSLGQQLADEISILPDMNGIVATFKCVNVPIATQHKISMGGAPPKPVTPAAEDKKAQPAQTPARPAPAPAAPQGVPDAAAQSPGGGSQGNQPSAFYDRTPVSGRVWTSEGVSEGIQIEVHTFGVTSSCKTDGAVSDASR